MGYVEDAARDGIYLCNFIVNVNFVEKQRREGKISNDLHRHAFRLFLQSILHKIG